MTPEGKLKLMCCKYLDSSQIYYERREAIGLSYKKGLPDIWCIINGKHVEIEFKREDGKGIWAVEQIKWQLKFQKMGVECWLIDDYDTFVTYVNRTIKEV